MLISKRPELDLRLSEQVDRWMAEAKPDVVFLAAGKVGGILANSTIQQILSPTTWRSPSKSSEVLMRQGCRSFCF